MKMTFSPESSWLLKQLKPFIRTHLASFALVLTSSLLVMMEPLIMRFLIDDVLRQGSFSLLLLIIGCFLLTYLGRILFNAWGVILSNRAIYKMIFRMRLHLLRQLQKLPVEYHERNSVGDLLHRLEFDVNLVGEITGQIMTFLLRTIITTVLILVTMSVMNLRLTLFILPLVPAFLLLRHRFQRPLRECSDSVQYQKGRMTAFLQDQISCMAQVQLVCRELTEACKFAKLSAGATRSDVKRQRMELIFASSSSLIIVLSVIAILGIGSYEVLLGTLTVGSMVAFYSYALQLFGPLYAVMDIYARFQRVGASTRRLLEVEQARISIFDRPDAVDVSRNTPARLELKNVSFRYRPDKPVLNEVAFTAECAEKIALVGASGSGKSTVARLIARLYDVDGGAVLVNGCDVRDLKLKSLRSTVSFVPQEAPIFDTTLLENLLYGNPKASKFDLERVVNVTQLHEVIRRLPAGWEEPLGPRGSKLSGGERQRVALARALLQQPGILVLDESTSALDAATEQCLFEAMSEISQTAITVVISHRLSTILWADRIIVVDQGRVIAEGSHTFLYGASATYRALCESQFESEPQCESAPTLQHQFSDAAAMAVRQ
jgi:ABC-type multidrug transport system fused ATPase/permease subunit